MKYRQRSCSCLLKCNREVTWISRQRPCVYTRVTEFKCEVSCGITAFVWIK